jgi:hypothetical protein
MSVAGFMCILGISVLASPALKTAGREMPASEGSAPMKSVTEAASEPIKRQRHVIVAIL